MKHLADDMGMAVFYMIFGLACLAPFFYVLCHYAR